MVRQRQFEDKPAVNGYSPPFDGKDRIQTNGKTSFSSRKSPSGPSRFFDQVKTFVRYAGIGVLIVVYVLVPATYGTCTWLRRNMIYLNWLNLTPNVSFTNPMASGLECARSFYLTTEPGIKVGVWHVLPQSRSHLCRQPSLGDLEFNDTRPVVLHFHGSGGHRGARHRIHLLRTLAESEIDAHVVTVDYRGFGDSTYARTTVQGIVRDVATLYRWIRQRVSADRVMFWGQSLGTGIAVHLANELAPDDSPLGLVLEAPYTTIPEASRKHPYTIFHRFYPFYDAIFVNSAQHPDTFYDAESRIHNVSSPVLILHAEDDETIPYRLGKLLYEKALLVRDPVYQPTQMVTYEGHLGYGHKHICSDPAVPGMINDFLRNATDLRSKVKTSPKRIHA